MILQIQAELKQERMKRIEREAADLKESFAQSACRGEQMTGGRSSIAGPLSLLVSNNRQDTIPDSESEARMPAKPYSLQNRKNNKPRLKSRSISKSKSRSRSVSGMSSSMLPPAKRRKLTAKVVKDLKTAVSDLPKRRLKKVLRRSSGTLRLSKSRDSVPSRLTANRSFTSCQSRHAKPNRKEINRTKNIFTPTVKSFSRDPQLTEALNKVATAGGFMKRADMMEQLACRVAELLTAGNTKSVYNKQKKQLPFR